MLVVVSFFKYDQVPILLENNRMTVIIIISDEKVMRTSSKPTSNWSSSGLCNLRNNINNPFRLTRLLNYEKIKKMNKIPKFVLLIYFKSGRSNHWYQNPKLALTNFAFLAKIQSRCKRNFTEISPLLGLDVLHFLPWFRCEIGVNSFKH